MKALKKTGVAAGDPDRVSEPLRSSRPLRFEKRLLDGIPSAGRRPKRNALHVVLVSALVCAVGILAFRGYAHIAKRRAVCHAMEALVQAIQREDPAGALALFAASPSTNQEAPSSPPQQDGRWALLTSLREELAATGLDWSRAQPYAFGGAEARVSSGDPSRKWRKAFTGHLYLQTEGRYWAIELTGRMERGAFRIVNVWRWFALRAIDEAQVHAHAEACYQAFLQEPTDETSPTAIEDPKFVFIEW